MNTVDDRGHLGILPILRSQNNVLDVAIGISSNVAGYEWGLGADVVLPRLVQEVDRLVIRHRRGIDVGITDSGLHCYERERVGRLQSCDVEGGGERCEVRLKRTTAAKTDVGRVMDE